MAACASRRHCAPLWVGRSIFGQRRRLKHKGRFPGLQINNLAAHALRLIIHMQQTDAALWLAAAVVGAAGIEEQLPVHFFIAGNVTMPEYYTTRGWKFLPRYFRAIMRITQDMHDTNATMAHYYFALDWQFEPHLVLFDVALHSYHRGNGL